MNTGNKRKGKKKLNLPRVRLPKQVEKTFKTRKNELARKAKHKKPLGKPLVFNSGFTIQLYE